VKFGRVIFEICTYVGGQMDVHTCSSQYFTPLPGMN